MNATLSKLATLSWLADRQLRVLVKFSCRSPKMAAIVNHSVRRYLQTTLAKAGKPVVEGPSAVSGGHEGGYKIWKNLTFFVAFPAIALCAVNCYLAHQNQPHEPAPFEKYEYLRLRSKRFPWGDGNHSLFHNPHVNPLPDGYEGHH